MPLKLNIGLSRKVGEANYGSRGASVNVELELEAALVEQPDKLRERIRKLFDSVRMSVTEELDGGDGQHRDAPRSNGRESSNGGNGAHANGSRMTGMRLATGPQVKAIYALCRQQGYEPGGFLRERCHVSRPEELTIRQASNLIDQLRESEGTSPSAGGTGHRPGR